MYLSTVLRGCHIRLPAWSEHQPPPAEFIELRVLGQVSATTQAGCQTAGGEPQQPAAMDQDQGKLSSQQQQLQLSEIEAGNEQRMQLLSSSLAAVHEWERNRPL
jgi:hypothetical protein